MKRGIIVCIFLAALVFLGAVSSNAWTGRMGGMGAPYALIEDESDFLTHPTGITQGKGLSYYGDLSFFKKDVSKWDISVNSSGSNLFYRNADGGEWNMDTRLGFALPLGAGRMGVFFEYGGNFISSGGRYMGHGYDSVSGGAPGKLDVMNDNDAIAGRILYAQPVFNGKAKLGGEFSVGHVTETSSVYTDSLGVWGRNNYHWDYNFLNGFTYALPYSSRYWEAKMKASAEAMIGSSKLNITPFGGLILDGDNRYDWDFGTPPWLFGGHKGSVSGYNIGTESWWRFPINKSISIPILAKAVYSEKKRDGDGAYQFSGLPLYYCGYENKEKALNIEVGGGIDAQIVKNSRFGAGLYYGYVASKNDFFFIGDQFGYVDYPSSPKWRENRITLRLAAETEISPRIILNGGFNYYYGWVKQDFQRTKSDGEYYDLALDGNNWGAGLSIGAAIKLNGVAFEPYLKGTYQNLNTSGTGIASGSPISGDYKKTQWIIGGGFAVKFN